MFWMKYKEFTELRFGIRMERNQAHLSWSFRPQQLSTWYTQPKTDWGWQRFGGQGEVVGESWCEIPSGVQMPISVPHRERVMKMR